MRVAIAAQVAAVVAISLSSSTVEAQSGDSIATCGPECTTEARTDSASGDRGWLVAFSAGVPGYGREAAAELMTIGVQWTRARPHRLGTDFAIGTMPRALTAGAAVAAMRVGVALPLPVVPGVMLLPSGGLSGVIGVGSYWGDARAGANVGLAAVAMGKGGTGARVGMTFHRFTEVNGAIWLLEMGMVTGPRR